MHEKAERKRVSSMQECQRLHNDRVRMDEETKAKLELMCFKIFFLYQIRSLWMDANNGKDHFHPPFPKILDPGIMAQE